MIVCRNCETDADVRQAVVMTSAPCERCGVEPPSADPVPDFEMFVRVKAVPAEVPPG